MILLLKGQTVPALEMMQKASEGYRRRVGLSMAYHATGQKDASDAALRN